ncbi:hypothetical protein C0J50_9054 [Silurus asotus]|uniref:Uncharacterized protein n=1 Tax=Silurus asotus TaxID=30991 RepID=A0AAD5AF73_SILAS|nr:hypothetical protein C0J50_9054 [Silurus asotus]
MGQGKALQPLLLGGVTPTESFSQLANPCCWEARPPSPSASSPTPSAGGVTPTESFSQLSNPFCWGVTPTESFSQLCISCCWEARPPSPSASSPSLAVGRHAHRVLQPVFHLLLLGGTPIESFCPPQPFLHLF